MNEALRSALSRLSIDAEEVADFAAALIRIPTVPSLYAPGESAAMTLLDANLVRHSLNIPVVAYGPGNESGHGPDEYVTTSDLAQVAEVYARFARDYLGVIPTAFGAP